MTYIWSFIMILIGIIFVVISNAPLIPGSLSKILEFTGTTFIGVFAVSFLYQVLIAKQHFLDFKNLLKSQLKELDSVQSKCQKLGVLELFETRNDYEQHYPLAEVIKRCPEKEGIVCVGRSLFQLLNKTKPLHDGLREGKIFKFAIIDHEKMNPSLEKVSKLYKTDIKSALEVFKDLISWATQNKAKGSIELRYHSADLPDSFFMFTTDYNEQRVVWDLGFGRDLSEKKIIVLNPQEPLGKDIKLRYVSIYNDASVQFKYSDGKIILNRFEWVF